MLHEFSSHHSCLNDRLTRKTADIALRGVGCVALNEAIQSIDPSRVSVFLQSEKRMSRGCVVKPI